MSRSIGHRDDRAVLLAREPLVLASAALILVNALHGADHIRQGLGRLTAEVIVGGQGLLLLALIPFVLALLRHRMAFLIAALIGTWTLIAVTASHLTRTGAPSAIPTSTTTSTRFGGRSCSP